MCNGYRHRPDCECGFGPHYLAPGEPLPRSVGDTGDRFIGVIRSRTRQKWASKSIIDKDKIIKGLGELGLSPKWAKSILKKYTEAGYPISESLWNELSKNQQMGEERKLMRMLGLRQEIVSDLGTIDLEIPLFRLQPPRTKNSKVSFEEKQSRTRGWSIFLEVPGYALGADLSLRLEAGGKIHASEDICKVIYLPVRIKRYLVNLFMGKICIAREKMVVEAGNKRTGQVYRRTIQSCKDYVPPMPAAPLIAEYNLSADLTQENSEFRFEWGKESNRFAKLTIPIPGIKPGIQVKIALERELALEFDLAPQYDYKLYPTPVELGISWVVSGDRSRLR